jgi:hypothetical protein
MTTGEQVYAMLKKKQSDFSTDRNGGFCGRIESAEDRMVAEDKFFEDMRDEERGC